MKSQMMPVPSKPLKNTRYEQFCLLFAKNHECFGNGTTAYMAAFEVDTAKQNCRKTARVSASKLLKKGIILARISFLLESALSDTQVDGQLLYLITQYSDLRVKIAAIREYNNLKGRIRQKMEITAECLSDQELAQEVQRLDEEIAASEQILMRTAD